MTTEAQPLTDLPDGVTDTFTWTCPCGATVHVEGSVEQSHDCPLSEDEKQAIRDQAAGEVEDAEQQQGVDPLQLASMLCVHANNRLGDQAKVSVDRQIALATAIATVELARWTQQTFALNAQIFNNAMAAQQRQQEHLKGPSGIVVPQVRV